MRPWALENAGHTGLHATGTVHGGRIRAAGWLGAWDSMLGMVAIQCAHLQLDSACLCRTLLNHCITPSRELAMVIPVSDDAIDRVVYATSCSSRFARLGQRG